MLYIFQGGSELVKIKIDRIEKKFEIATSKTNYRFMPQPFWTLFGDKKGEEEAKREQSEMELLSNEKFEEKLIRDFAKNGYKLIKKAD